jgi:hypothetical protein
MPSTTKVRGTMRIGDPLRIGREAVPFGRNILADADFTFAVQHRLFVNDPWELIAEAIHRSLPDNQIRDIAHSFRRQAKDYFQAATVGSELAVRPVLLYYAFLNLSKAYAVARGNTRLTGRTTHGVSAAARTKAIPGSLIKFAKTGVFQELLDHLDGDTAILNADLRLGHLLPQILPGHRLWCYATRRAERFLPVERFEIRHLAATKHVWLNVYLSRDDLDRLGVPEGKVLSEAGLAGDFEVANESTSDNLVCFQQRSPESYRDDPAVALVPIIFGVRNKIWETVKVASPYRKHYLYCCPTPERHARLPQMLSVYLLMYFLSSVTRYSPLYFEDLLESKYGPLFQTFISESPMQFLYLRVSDILGREVSKPAII